MSVRLHAERFMSLEWRARSSSLAWSNPLAWWWSLLTLVSGANIAVWFLLYRRLHQQPTGSLGSTSGIELMLLLCAVYVFGCAFRSFLPRADVQRICLFDTWLSSVVVGRSVATVAEICFAAQWAIILHRLGTMTVADTTLNAPCVIAPLLVSAHTRTGASFEPRDHTNDDDCRRRSSSHIRPTPRPHRDRPMCSILISANS